MAYDSESDRIIMFGGICSATVCGDTWAYDYNTNSWTNMNPAIHPSAGYGTAMAYDAQSDRVILFGGSNSNETWAYDYNTNSWANMEPTTHPSGRSWHAMAYDTESDRVILFGGSTSAGSSNETWSYDFDQNAWTNLEPAGGPSARYSPAMAYDSLADRIILFGGFAMPVSSYGETWSYDANTNAWTHLTPPSSPTWRYSHAMAFDALSGFSILFGGRDLSSARSDTWSYSWATNMWIPLSSAGPTNRHSHAMAYDAESAKVILFAGAPGVGLSPPKDTWALDSITHTWAVKLTSPSPRRGEALAYDSMFDRVILFGGLLPSGPSSDETWAYEVGAHSWTLMNPSLHPHGRFGSAVTYDSRSHRVIVFGGCCSGTGRSLNETWVYDFLANVWTERTPAVGPSARYGSAMAYDSESDRSVLFGGTNSNETWAYDFNANTWTNLRPAGGPSARALHAMVYDPSSDRIVLFGGSGSNETWTYDLNTNTWTNLSPPESPSPRGGHAMVYDAFADRVILFGGTNGSARFSDSWSFDLNTGTWTNLDLGTHPSAREGHAMAYAAQSTRTVLFGGYDGQSSDETWLFC